MSFPMGDTGRRHTRPLASQHIVLYLDGRQGPDVVDLAASEIVAPLRDAFD